MLACCSPILLLDVLDSGCSSKESRTSHTAREASIVASTNILVSGESELLKPTNDGSMIRPKPVKSIPKEVGPLYRNMSPGEKQFAAEIFAEMLKLDDYKTATTNFLKKLEETTSPEDLREWAYKRIHGSAGKKNDSALWFGVNIAYEEIPSSIRNIAPTNIFVGAAVERKPPPDHVVIAWGSGMSGFYGIMVGDPPFKPQSEQEYLLKWQDGIYVWHSNK